MPKMVTSGKWVLYKHTSDFQRIIATALDIANQCKGDLSNAEKGRMQDRMAALNLWKTRNPTDKPLDSINHRINTLEFWMFGHEEKNGKSRQFIFSPLGNLLLKYVNDDEKRQFIFTAMLFSIQFKHPANDKECDASLYPFRLIYQLLLDPRLNGKLYNFEAELLLVFMKDNNPRNYEILVRRMLFLRQKSNAYLKRLYESDEHTFVNSVHEWETFTTKLLTTIGCLKRTEGERICSLYHPQKANSRSAPTPRHATRGYVEIPDEIRQFVEEMLRSYSPYQPILRLDDPERLTNDVIKEIYSFYPQELLDQINEDDEFSKLLNLPRLIEEYSHNPENSTAYLFEDVLEEGFNLFYNVEAKKIGGSGHTDIECLCLTLSKKFAVDAKSTANKLYGLNTKRLEEHRDEIGAKYTIIITPRYTPGVKRDIRREPIVIILASTFAEYLYNNLFHEVDKMDYEELDEIIMNNYGQDVSELISKITLNKFAASVD